MVRYSRFHFCYETTPIHRGVHQFFDGGEFEFFLWTGKFREGFGIFFFKNPSKLKKNPKEGV